MNTITLVLPNWFLIIMSICLIGTTINKFLEIKYLNKKLRAN